MEIKEINKSVTEGNDSIAKNIGDMLKEKGIFCINLMGAPGSGKTTFIEGVSEHIGVDEMAVIQGDLESDVDKKRLEENGIMTYQINTHSGCHLNAKMIRDAIDEMDLDRCKYLIVENVGNLVCPAGVKIGQHMNVVVSSTTEGSDKPKKYPLIFLDSDLVVISKMDLAAMVDFDGVQYKDDIRNIKEKLEIVEVSRKNPESFVKVKESIDKFRDEFFE